MSENRRGFLTLAVAVFLLVFSGFYCELAAQSRMADSLKGLIEKEKTDTTRLNLLLKLCRERFNIADYDKALQSATEARSLALKTGNKKAEALTYNLAGSIYRGQGNYEESLKQYFTALKIREGIADSFGISNSYNNIGLLYWGMEKYDRALDYHTKSLRLRERIGDSDAIAASHLNLGMTYYKRGMKESKKNPQYAQDYLQSALVSYQSALSYFEHKNAQPSMAACYNNMANVFADKATLGDSVSAMQKRENYLRSLEYYQKTLTIMQNAGDLQSVAITLNNISLIYREMNDYAKADEYAHKGLEAAQQAGAKNEVMEVYKNMADLYQLEGDYKKAFECHKLFSLTKDSLLNEENNRQMVEMETKYETEKKDKEILKKDAETRQAAQQRNFFIGGFAMMLVLAFFIFRGYRQKQKANIEITRQKMLVEEKQQEILDSIYYARRIQRSILTGERYIQKNLERLRKKT